MHIHSSTYFLTFRNINSNIGEQKHKCISNIHFMYTKNVYLYPLYTSVLAYIQDIFRIFVLSIFYSRHVVRTS